MKKYSLGFIFNASLNKVLLMHRIKPEWQKGKINGIGGKVEEHESALSSMVRETQEETALTIKENEWQYIANLSSPEFFTEVFACIYPGNIADAKSLEEQKIEWFSLDKLPSNMINNLRWLIPLSLDKVKHNEPKSVTILY
jgi:8-oxo-dGTP diphosphatase